MVNSVTMRSFDPARSGANTAETVLTPAAVRTRGVKQVRVLQIPDDPRLEAQPLYLAGVRIGGATHNVVIQATMGNWVYAWDIDTGALLWKKFLGTPIQGSQDIDAHNINVHWGVLSTPVIDAAVGRIYICYWSSANGTWQSGHHLVVSLDVTTGDQVNPPLSLEGAKYSPGGALPSRQFNSLERKQRSGLSIVKGAVLIPFGTIAETAESARGWLIAVDIASWSIAATWCSTVKGNGGGVWMSGSAPAIQGDGSIWVVTGNGDFDGVSDFAESVVRLRYTPPTAGANGSLTVTGWWTPWTDDGRTGGNPEGEAAKAALRALPRRMPSNFRPVPHLARLGIAPMDMGSAWSDQDVGASGIVLVEEPGVALVSSKDGILYTIGLDNPGETKPQDLAVNTAPANYRKLAAPPILYTFFSPDVDPAPANPIKLNTLAAGRTHHLHGTPVVWKSSTQGWMHFCGGENGNLRAWKFNADHSSAYLACSEAYASAAVTQPPGGMPGWSVVLSANGGTGAIVWGMIPYGDANMEVTGSRLIAYDAENFGQFNAGGSEIMPIWDSQDWAWNMLHPKFNRPIVADGTVIVPTYGGQLLVLQLG
jgi:hypothetical protein